MAKWEKFAFTKVDRFNKSTNKSTNKNTIFIARSPFQKDRDRILYSKAFRRMMDKTQVFLTNMDDHVRNRMTHSIEVAQIATTICKTLGLNEEIAEAIALGHDIGHTAFGHMGEATLNNIMHGCCEDIPADFNKIFDREKDLSTRGYKHNWQSVRNVVDLISHKGNKGLNLNYQTIWGILNHSVLNFEKCFYASKDKKSCHKGNGSKCDVAFDMDYYEKRYQIRFNSINYFTFEAIVVTYSDEIAQRHHDIEDGLHERIISHKEIIELIKELKGNHHKNLIKKYGSATTLCKLNTTDFMQIISSFIVDLYVEKTLEAFNTYFEKIDKEYGNLEDLVARFVEEKTSVEMIQKNIFTDSFFINDNVMQKKMMNLIVNSHKVQVMNGRCQYVLKKVFAALVVNPQQLPDSTVIQLFINYLNECIFDAVNKYVEHEKYQHQTVYVKTFRKLYKSKESETYIHEPLYIVQRLRKRLKFSNKVEHEQILNILEARNDTSNNLISLIKQNRLTQQKYYNSITFEKSPKVGELRNILNAHLFSDNDIFKAAIMRTICDYIAGMTNRRADEEYKRLHGITYDVIV